MRRFCLVLVMVAAACGGPQVPTHNGYKSEKAKPWKSAKKLAFDDKLEAKTDGSLSYPDMRRARWYAIDLPTHAELTYRLEVTPPGDGTNDDFDMAIEVLNPANHVISKADQEDGDAHELVKTHTLLDLAPGHYLIHVYLQGRMDTGDYVLNLSYKAVAAAEVKTDFPAQVAFLPALSMVPLQDDTPAGYHPTKAPTTTVSHTTTHHTSAPKVVPVAAPVLATINARVINMQVTAAGTQITVSRGTDTGAAMGMNGVVTGIPGGTFKLESCTPRSCSGTVKATPDQLKAASSVVLSP